MIDGTEFEEVPEVDVLPTRDERFGQLRSLAEIDVPQHGIRLRLVPWLNSGKRYIEDHNAAYLRRKATREGIGDDATDVVTDDVRTLQLQLRSELVDVLRQIRRVVASGRRLRAADAAKV